MSFLLAGDPAEHFNFFRPDLRTTAAPERLLCATLLGV